MNNLQVDKWDESYERQENYILSPKEEVVKFLSRYVKKKNEEKFKIAPHFNRTKLTGLDLGCGIGRQTILMEEFGIQAYGVDISSVAINKAKKLGEDYKLDLSDRLIVLQDNTLPFENDFFDVAISDSVLDSMEFQFACRYLQELDRTVTSLLYLNLICGDRITTDFAGDLQVQSQHEKGTIQSYYNEVRIQELIAGTRFSIIALEKHVIYDLLENKEKSRFHVVLEKQKE